MNKTSYSNLCFRPIYFLSCSFISFSLFIASSAFGQEDSLKLRAIYDMALTEGHAYENLRQLCKDVGNRLSGSANAEKAVRWSKAKMESYGFDKVWLEPVMVPKWTRGKEETCYLLPERTPLKVLALGFSVGTDGPLEAEVVEFETMQALKDAPEGSLNGKIAFLNQAMNPKLISTFSAYGGCSGGRVRGPSVAAEKGAIGFVMRSLGLRADDFPHTGVMYYSGETDSIPAFALSTNASYALSQHLEKKGSARIVLEANCAFHPDVESHNVVGEITGSELPNKVITIGGHLDSWDVGEGAHDDGAGVIQSLEVLRLIKESGIKPRHSVRCVFFMNEENGARGGRAYAENCQKREEEHLAAMESDRGGFTPRGFTVDGLSAEIDYLAEWISLFEPYNIHFIKKGYGGVDINPLKESGTPLIGFVPDSQRYFDVHHTENDVFENVNQRELELGAATMTSLIYLIDKYGMPERIVDK
ncbi:MAG TPA: M20/M25/M40 family metallo-hydrolase [Cryomorphaceae bacterium]|nr:M20/M25/M40 family metallo-hydrolase [Cryomorphaceae bacterium]